MTSRARDARRCGRRIPGRTKAYEPRQLLRCSSTEKNLPHQVAQIQTLQAVEWWVILNPAFQNIRIVYGDLGMAPLYVYPGIFAEGNQAQQRRSGRSSRPAPPLPSSTTSPRSLSLSMCSSSYAPRTTAMLAKALLFMHEREIAHLDVKPDNIYVKNGVYKLGDFGCATQLNSSLPVEEGDARYMPQEILNDNFDHLDKVDIFSMGASMYELIRGSPLPESGPQFLNLREGKLPLLPGHSLHFQNLLKVMMDPDPTTRPSAKELVANPIFDRIRRNGKT